MATEEQRRRAVETMWPDCDLQGGSAMAKWVRGQYGFLADSPTVRVAEALAEAEGRGEASGAQAEREAVVAMLRGLFAERRLSYAALGALSGILEANEKGKHRDVARAQAARKPAGGG